MDPENVGKKNKKRVVVSSDEDANSKSKRILISSTPTGFEAGSIADAFAELLSQMKPYLNHLVQVEVKNALQTHLDPLLESLREKKEKGDEIVIESEIEKFKLVFMNEIASIIFTNNNIIGENGEPLQVAICDATTNTIIRTTLLSSAQIEFFVLDGEYGSGQQEETHHSMSDFDKSILSPRDGKRPLLVGIDQKLTLKNGVGLATILSITDNSSWMKSKMFRIGAKIIDEKILSKFPKIGLAVSKPFRVRDHRGEVNKKHHPPSTGDEVWRLEGIGKDGAYHKNLSLHGITNVGDFLKAYHRMGSTKLRKLLGIKVPEKTWNMIVKNAFECVSLPNEQNSKDNCLGNKVMGPAEDFTESPQVFENSRPSFDEVLGMFYYEDTTPFLSGEASTSFEVASQAWKPNIVNGFGSN